MLVALLISIVLVAVACQSLNIVGLNYLPPKDADLDAWCTNFSTKITATPTAYGLIAGQATTYATARSAFTTALAVAVTASTRTQSTVATKNTTRAALLVLTRAYMKIVQGYPSITPSLLEDLQLTVRKTTPTPIGAPTTAPIVTCLNSSGSAINVRVSDETTPDSRRRPFGAIGMELWFKLGPTAPASIDECAFKQLITKNTTGPGSRAAVVQFDGADAGKTAYFYGRWINRRGDVGPICARSQMVISA